MKTIEEIKAKIIKDNIGINHENDEALCNQILHEFVKRGFVENEYEILFTNGYPIITYSSCINGDGTHFVTGYTKNSLRNINIITLEEFIARYPVEEREIIGYVFKDLNKWCEFDRANKEWLKGIYKNHGFHFSKGCNLYDRLVNAGLLEVLCEPVYKEVEKRGEFIGLPVAPPSQITKEGSTPIIQLYENGDIFVKDRLVIKKDKEIVDALREFVKHFKFE